MKTWKTMFTICRGKKTGKFANKGKCGAFKRQRVRRTKAGFLFV